ncbi:heme NO-binding domain-containing protein [Paraglaciecola sp. 25GB23A]|uniref:heme NO-binding domain-containing protein n=1 Tax=Paraglaciecola sp. 25GB23A TaxID=3156068 RepID=UPI0032AEBA71|tara:strand:- start:758 stop:1303 length:546 start_codon:yes stop_codon:yes gene_type:complete
MQGLVFTALSDMVIDKMGLGMWNDVLNSVNPVSGGVYTKGMQYDDDELMAIVADISERTQIPVTDLVRTFGQYIFKYLFASSPADLSKVDNVRDFLLLIDGVIHKEVKRLYPQAYLPKFDYDTSTDGVLVMYYQSKRKLCHLSEGLIFSAAAQFNQTVTIDHPECMHNGAEKCKLIISILD